MYDSQSKGITYTAGFFMMICFTVAAVVLATAINSPIWSAMTGLPMDQMEKGMIDPANSNAIKVMQIITAIVGFFLPAVVTAFLLNHRPFRLLGFSLKIKWPQVLLVIFIMSMALLVSGALSYFNNLIPLSDYYRDLFDSYERLYQQQVEAIVTLNNPTQFLIALFIMAFLPALCEEALFRGGLQNLLTRSTRSPWPSIIVVSIIFSAVHFSWYGFLSRFFLGIVLGAIFHYSGRLWLSIIAHFFNNALAITLLYIAKMEGKSFKDAMNEGGDTYWGIFALPVLIVLIMWFSKLSKKYNAKPHDIESQYQS